MCTYLYIDTLYLWTDLAHPSRHLHSKRVVQPYCIGTCILIFTPMSSKHIHMYIDMDKFYFACTYICRYACSTYRYYIRTHPYICTVHAYYLNIIFLLCIRTYLHIYIHTYVYTYGGTVQHFSLIFCIWVMGYGLWESYLKWGGL